MLERRKSFRGRVYYGGRIAFNGRHSSMDCIVRNFSDTGAKVEFDTTRLITGEVDFTIEQKGYAFHARMIWRRGDQAGFLFRDPRRTETNATLDWAMRLRASERINRDLLRQLDRLRLEY